MNYFASEQTVENVLGIYVYAGARLWWSVKMCKARSWIRWQRSPRPNFVSWIKASGVVESGLPPNALSADIGFCPFCAVETSRNPQPAL
jgi:hypothetical protein